MANAKVDMDKVLMNVKTVTVGGTEYKLQKLPPRQAFELREQWHIDGVPNEIRMFELVLEHIVVSPKVTIDDFEDAIDVEELVGEAIKYQYRTRGK